jgi:hypothetical protein
MSVYKRGDFRFWELSGGDADVAAAITIKPDIAAVYEAR